ncbi:unnamed protein product [Porites lobata]|uniref:Uncharacterized protein n=1 Tax=Porites lobata TaxID=104759 RepID=A0ABN8QJE5_9CNID|nr:unnamed protein product [Porites lobata]
MESRKSIEDFLREVDEDILIYAGELRSNGFMSAASTKYLTENDLAGIPEGHKRLILNMKDSLQKNATLWRKNLPKQLKKEKCWKIITEESKRLNCHYRNHTVRSCQTEKYESEFFCGELTRHPDEKMKLQEQKNKIRALETSATKLEQELRSWDAALIECRGQENSLLRRTNALDLKLFQNMTLP